MKQGQRMNDTRLMFKSGLQSKFLREIKKKSKYTWSQLAIEVGFSRSTITDWNYEKTTLPFSAARKLLEIYPLLSFQELTKNWIEKILEPNWGQIKNKIKAVIIPENSQKLAEFIGIVLGDGHISRKEIVIASEFPDEKVYVEYVKSVVRDLFGIDSATAMHSLKNSVIYLKIRSVLIVKHLNNMNMKCGKKKTNKTTIPAWIFTNKDYLRGCLRGLVDTDGGLFHKQKGYKRGIVEFQTKSDVVSRDIKRALKALGFKASKSNLNVRIQNQEEIIRFFREIGAANPKNIVRFQRFMKNGVVPSPKKMKSTLINFSLSKVPYKYEATVV